jgi:hypothetical protein
MLEGIKERTCIRCKEKEYLPVDALGHRFGSWRIIKKADCTTPGVQVRTCPRCKTEEHAEIPPIGHNFTDWKTDPSGIVYHLCTRCKLKETMDEFDARIAAEQLAAMEEGTKEAIQEPGQ